VLTCAAYGKAEAAAAKRRGGVHVLLVWIEFKLRRPFRNTEMAADATEACQVLGRYCTILPTGA
jgi:hypothetical protein